MGGNNIKQHGENQNVRKFKGDDLFAGIVQISKIFKDNFKVLYISQVKFKKFSIS